MNFRALKVKLYLTREFHSAARLHAHSMPCSLYDTTNKHRNRRVHQHGSARLPAFTVGP